MVKKNNVKEIGEGILAFLKKNKIENSLPEVIDYLKSNLKSEKVVVVSPKGLSNSEKKDLDKLLEKIIGNTPGEIDFVEDESLIDGLVINYKDRMWDFSLKSQIDKLKQN